MEVRAKCSTRLTLLDLNVTGREGSHVAKRNIARRPKGVPGLRGYDNNVAGFGDHLDIVDAVGTLAFNDYEQFGA